MNELQRTTGSPFDAIRQVDGRGEYWSARDLMPLLGYDKWERFEGSIERAKAAAENTGATTANHFPGAGRMVDIGSGARREIRDYHLTRYACYLVAMNGDPRKPEIAAAQTYFATKTRQAELQAVPDMATPEGRLMILQMAIEAERRAMQAERTNAILMHVTKTYTATEIAKELGFRSATALNQDLAERRIQFKQNKTWVLYSDYANRGYTEIKQEVLDNGKVIYHRRWTQLGREFLLNLYSEEATA